MILCITLILMLFTQVPCACSQANTGAQSMPSYNLRVSVDEVSLTLHAADAHGLPINDLRLKELTILNNGKPPQKILAFQSLQMLPSAPEFS